VSKATLRTLATAFAAVGLSVGVAACGGGNDNDKGTGKPGAGKPPVTLGAKNFTEQFILGQLYTQALRAKGYRVTLKNNIGSSEITDKALTSGKIDGYPEYTGTILSTIAQETKRPTSADAAYDAAKKFEEGRGFTLTEKTPFFNTDALAVLSSYAQKNGLKQVPDLKKLGAKVTYGAPPESRTRFEGLVGLRKVYGLTQMKFKPLAIGLQYKALDGGQIQTGDVFTTDGQLQGSKYVVLADPKNVFGFQNVAMVISKKVLSKEGSEFADTINAVSAKLTTEAMRKMNAAVDLDKNAPAAVAKQFLQANGLL
jgi:osmoprotectant transport system substrate-binding protein